MLVWMFAAPVYYLYKIKNEMIPTYCDATDGHFFQAWDTIEDIEDHAED